MASPYQSPTRRLAAEVSIDDGTCLRGDLYLHPNTLAPGGYESAATMMNNQELFFPVAEPTGAVTLVGKGRTVSLSYAPDEGLPTPDIAQAPVRLEVWLSDGRNLSGWAILELPREYPRTLDFLNGPGPFLAIHGEERVHLVNRAHIRTVHPRD
jgi:hypothetical protein